MIHRNLKQQRKKNQFSQRLFKKSPFCTFSCINPGFGGSWHMLWICYGYFFLLSFSYRFKSQKNSNFMHGFKSAILEKLKNCQNGTFQPMHDPSSHPIVLCQWEKYSPHFISKFWTYIIVNCGKFF